MTVPEFKYDVAFSFHSKDESVATQLNDLLQDRFETFIYSRRQEVLAGTNGEETFNAVFGSQSRVVVVFYRPEWGQTPFTRIEETAIRNRAFDHGYDFTLFIPTTTPPEKPQWLPKAQLYYGLTTYGIEGVAAVVQQKIQERGGETRPETVTDRAARLERSNQLNKAREQFRRSEVGVRAANEAVDRLISALDDRVTAIAQDNPSLAGLKLRKVSEFWLVNATRTCLLLHWWNHYVNSLEDSVLRTEVHRGVPRIPGLIPAYEASRLLRKVEFDYRLVRLDRHAFVERGSSGKAFTPEELAEHLLKLFMDTAETHERE